MADKVFLLIRKVGKVILQQNKNLDVKSMFPAFQRTGFPKHQKKMEQCKKIYYRLPLTEFLKILIILR